MKMSIRDLLWLTLLVAALLACWLQSRELRRERDELRAQQLKSQTMVLLWKQQALQQVEVARLAAKLEEVNASRKTIAHELQVKFAQSDLKRATDCRDAIEHHIKRLERESVQPSN